MFSFDKLTRRAQRAAFAKMALASKAAKAKKAVTPHPNLTKRYSHVETGKDGKLRSVGTISLAEAAERMFGTKGAQERIAKYNARHTKKAKRPPEPKLQPAKPISAAERMALAKKAGKFHSSLDEGNAVIRARRGRGREIETRVEPHRRAATLAALKAQGYAITHDSHAKS